MQTDVLVNQMSKTERIVQSTLSPKKDKTKSVDLPIDLENEEERNKLLHRKVKPSYPRHNTSNIPVRKSSNIHSSEKKKHQSRLPVFKASPKYATTKIQHIVDENDLEEPRYKTNNPIIEPLPEEELLAVMKSFFSSSESSPEKINQKSPIKMVEDIDSESDEETKIVTRIVEKIDEMESESDTIDKIDPLEDNEYNTNQNFSKIPNESDAEEESEENKIDEKENKDDLASNEVLDEEKVENQEIIEQSSCSEEGLPNDILTEENENNQETVETPVKEVKFNLETSPLKACDAEALESSDSEEFEKSVFANNDDSESEEEEITKINIESIDKPRFVPRRSPVVPVIVSDDSDDDETDRPLAIYRQLSYSDSDDS